MRPDVVVGVNIVDLYASTRRLRGRGIKLRTVMSLHGLAADLLGDLRREADWLDAVIATNRLASLLCTKHAGVSPERAFYAPYGVDVCKLSVLPRPAPSPTLNIAWVGRLEQEQKRLDTICEILTHLDQLGVDYVLRIAGDGPDRRTLLADLSYWIVSGRVEYLGPLPADRIGAEVYAKSDVLILTSYWETGPIVVWEAMAAGLAVVSSRYIGSGLEAALAHDENCLLFPIGGGQQAAAQIARLRDVNLRDRLVRSGQKLVIERYSIDLSVNAWAECLNSILRLPIKASGEMPDRQVCAGLLDRLLGVSLGESVRGALGIHFKHASAGGEWPHTRELGSNEKLLLEKAEKMDINLSSVRP